LLAQVLGIPWSRVHEEADRLEHDLSPETAARVAELLRDAAVCPHGNPMPGREAVTDALIPLLEGIPGQPYALARIHEEIERDRQLMAFLEQSRLLPGVDVQVVEILPFNETVTLCCAGQIVVLGLSVARRMWLGIPSSAAASRKEMANGQERQEQVG
jgi:DtxR family Mn-dependent transcriptional regulator